MVPKGWNQGHIEDFFILQRGFDITKKSACEGTIPVYSSSGVAYFHNVAKVKGPGIITGRKGSVGPVYLVEEDFWPHDTTLWVKDFRGNHINYVKYFMDFLRLERFDESSSVPTLNRNNVHGVKCVFPPIYEQKQISLILSTWDKAIISSEQLLINSQQQKKAIMQQLLTGKKRLTGFSDKWKTKTLDEIGDIKSAGVDKKIIEGEISVRLLNFTDVFKQNFIYSRELNHWVTAPQHKVIGCNVERGDVFFTPSSETRDEAAISAVVAEDIEECCYSYHVVRLRFSEEWDLNYKAYAFSTDSFRKQAYKLADGSGQRYVISQGNFRKMQITYPEYEEQVAIGKVLKNAEDETIVLQKKLNYLKQEKKALMQQLLTGKRRVKLN